MIKRIDLRNVLAFRSLDLPLRPLTLLSGTNSAGKSSILHVLAMLHQSSGKTLPEAVMLNGDLVALGVGRDLLHADPMELDDEPGVALEITLRRDDATNDGWRLAYDIEANVLPVIGRLRWEIDDDLWQGFQYLRADRIVPEVSYPKDHEAVTVQGWLGTRGEHSANYLRVHEKDAPGCQLARHPAAVGPGLLDQVNAWLNELSPGTGMTVHDVPETDFVRLAFTRSGPDVPTPHQRPTNVGFGLTYALPVILACLIAAPGSLLLVENPEAHLHPAGQAMLGRLCALAASGGAQVVVETHSDHVLNAVRLAVRTNDIPADQVLLHFFSREENVLQPRVQSIEVGPDGMLPSWPSGFFDQWDRALDELLG